MLRILAAHCLAPYRCRTGGWRGLMGVPGTLPAETPPWTAGSGAVAGFWNQCPANEYCPGQGIRPHTDEPTVFEGPILSLSLLSDTVMVLGGFPGRCSARRCGFPAVAADSERRRGVVGVATRHFCAAGRRLPGAPARHPAPRRLGPPGPGTATALVQPPVLRAAGPEDIADVSPGSGRPPGAGQHPQPTPWPGMLRRCTGPATGSRAPGPPPVPAPPADGPRRPTPPQTDQTQCIPPHRSRRRLWWSLWRSFRLPPVSPKAPVRGTCDSTLGSRGGVSDGWRHSARGLERRTGLPSSSFCCWLVMALVYVHQRDLRWSCRGASEPARTILSPPTSAAGRSLPHLPFERELGGTGPGQ